LSANALEVARRNGMVLAGDRVRWIQGDWYAALARRRFDALLSNPPYIAEDDAALRGDGLRHEPRLALTPGGDGLAAFHTLINGAHRHLKPGGWLVLEHGAAQGETLRSLLVARGFDSVTSHRDLAGHERVTEAKLAA
jgi:release factor glutamine methyltransferase